MFQRNTRQRQIILDELRKLTSHPTAAELYDIVRCRLPRVSLGTVYRNLDLLTRMGTIHKLEWSGGEARFDGNPQGHDHLRCVCCGRVDDLDSAPVDVSAEATRDPHGYEILGHRLEFFGLCPDCRRKPHSESNENTKGD